MSFEGEKMEKGSLYNLTSKKEVRSAISFKILKQPSLISLQPSKNIKILKITAQLQTFMSVCP